MAIPTQTLVELVISPGGTTTRLKAFRSAGANVNAKEGCGNTALMCARKRGDLEIAEIQSAAGTRE
jgi:hypothetical protein